MPWAKGQIPLQSEGTRTLRARLGQQRGQPWQDGITQRQLPALSWLLCCSDLLPWAEVAHRPGWYLEGRQGGPGLAAGQSCQLLRRGLWRAAGDFVGGFGLLTLCSPRVVNGAAQLWSCPLPACLAESQHGCARSWQLGCLCHSLQLHLPALALWDKERCQGLVWVGRNRSTLPSWLQTLLPDGSCGAEVGGGWERRDGRRH